MTSFARGAVLIAGAAAIYLALDLLLLVFAGVLLAIFLRSLARWLADQSGMSIGWALAATVFGLLGVAVLAGMLYAPGLAEQSEDLSQTLPKAFDDLTSRLEEYTWGRWLLDEVDSEASDVAVTGPARAALDRLMSATVAVVVVLFSALYFAAEPGVYVRGLLRLVPVPRRRRAAETLMAIGHVLRWWLLGQVLAMMLVGLAMGAGLAIIGVQLSFLLGLLAGLFEFIPLLGPVIALGPALLLALTHSAQQAGYVLVLYGVVQTAEGYVLTPLVQRKAVELPPVVTISAQVALSWAAGPVGLLVAVPLVATLMVTIQMLYANDRLGDRLAADLEEVARQEVEQARTGMMRGVPLEPARPLRSVAASDG